MMLFHVPTGPSSWTCSRCGTVDVHGLYSRLGLWVCARCDDYATEARVRVRREQIRRWQREGVAYLATLGRRLVRREVQLPLFAARRAA